MGQSTGYDGRKSHTDTRSAAAEWPGSDRRDSLICHGGLADLIAIAPLAKAMALPSRLALLVATVSLMSLPSPYLQPALRTAIALSTVATDTDCERRSAGRVGAKPKAQNSVPVDIHLSHSEDYVI